MRTYDIEVTRDGRWWMIHVPDLARQRISRPQLRMLQSWPEWIRTTTASIAGSCGITATTLIGVSAGTLWWPPSTTLASFLRTSPRGRRSCAVAGSAVRTYIRPNRYPGRCMSRDIGACSETFTYLKRAIEHGVVPARVAELDLPANTATIRAERRSNGARLHFGERRNGHSGDQGTRTPR